MAYKRKPARSTRRKSSTRKRAPRRKTARRRASPQTIRLVIEQVPATELASPIGETVRETVKSKKSKF